MLHVKVMVAHEAGNHFSDVVYLGHLNQHRNVVEKYPVAHVIVPAEDRQATLWLKKV